VDCYIRRMVGHFMPSEQREPHDNLYRTSAGFSYSDPIVQLGILGLLAAVVAVAVTAASR
jgi:hypothetical protein